MAKQDRRLTFWQNFICGGCAGVGSRSLTSPLDVVKILFQVGTKETQSGFFQAFAKIYKTEGLKAFWKGNGVACLRLFPFNAIQFAFFNEFKKVLTNPNTGRMPAWASGSSGAIAGIVATVSVYPLDLVKTRLTVQKHGQGEKLYNGIWDCLTKVFKQEGFMAMYAGVSCSIAGVIPFAGFTFMSYEILDWAWGKPKNELKGWQSFVNGCLAGAFAQTFSFPFDTVRKKMQAQARHGAMQADVQFNGMLDCFSQTIKKKGVLGLWAGTIANLAKVAPYAGFIFYIFEWTKRVYLYWNGFTVSPFREQLTPGVDQSLTPQQLKKVIREKKAVAAGKIAPKQEVKPSESKPINSSVHNKPTEEVKKPLAPPTETPKVVENKPNTPKKE